VARPAAGIPESVLPGTAAVVVKATPLILWWARCCPRQGAPIGVQRNRPGRPHAGHGWSHPIPAGWTADPAARFPAAGGADDCGLPPMTGTSERSVPLAVDPLNCPSRLCPGARIGGAFRGRDSCESPTRARADEPAGSAPPASAASVLRRQWDSEALAPLLPAPWEDGSAPPGSHPGAKSVLVDAALVPRPIRWLHTRASSKVSRGN